MRFPWLLAACLLCGVLAPVRAPNPRQLQAARNLMVESDVAAAGIKTPAILAALKAVPRHEFVPAEMRQIRLLRHGPADR